MPYKFYYAFMEINCPLYLHETIFIDTNMNFQHFLEMARNFMVKNLASAMQTPFLVAYYCVFSAVITKVSLVT